MLLFLSIWTAIILVLLPINARIIGYLDKLDGYESMTDESRLFVYAFSVFSPLSLILWGIAIVEAIEHWNKQKAPKKKKTYKSSPIWRMYLGKRWR